MSKREDKQDLKWTFTKIYESNFSRQRKKDIFLGQQGCGTQGVKSEIKNYGRKVNRGKFYTTRRLQRKHKRNREAKTYEGAEGNKIKIIVKPSFVSWKK